MLTHATLTEYFARRKRRNLVALYWCAGLWRLLTHCWFFSDETSRFFSSSSRVELSWLSSSLSLLELVLRLWENEAWNQNNFELPLSSSFFEFLCLCIASQIFWVSSQVEFLTRYTTRFFSRTDLQEGLSAFSIRLKKKIGYALLKPF